MAGGYFGLKDFGESAELQMMKSQRNFLIDFENVPACRLAVVRESGGHPRQHHRCKDFEAGGEYDHQSDNYHPHHHLRCKG